MEKSQGVSRNGEAWSKCRHYKSAPRIHLFIALEEEEEGSVF